MGIFGGKDHFFSSKFITAKITDAQRRFHLVAIKYTIGDYFLARINGVPYVFKINPEEIQTQFNVWTKSIKVLDYTTKHYAPLSPDKCKELELIIKKNGLPHIDRMMFNMLEQLGRTEGKKFKPHKLAAVKKLFGKRDDLHAENMRNIATFLEDLTVDEIVTPVKEITQFLEKDFIATDPQWIAEVGGLMVQADIENRRITNVPMGAKKSYAKILLLVFIVGIVAVIGFLVYDSGMLEGGLALPGMGSFAPTQTPNQIASKYPTPESARIAIDNGQAKMSDFPPDFQKYIRDFKPPKVTPKENAIALTP